MTAPKPGDRVRVEYEAEYNTTAGDGHLVDVVHEGQDDYAVLVPAGAKLTVLPKPLRVGDKVRLGVDPEPPVGTVLLTEGGVALKRLAAGWTGANTLPYCTGWLDFAIPDDEATVVWLPEDES